jgi:hypothetical protein
MGSRLAILDGASATNQPDLATLICGGTTVGG